MVEVRKTKEDDEIKILTTMLQEEEEAIEVIPLNDRLRLNAGGGIVEFDLINPLQSMVLLM